MRTLKTKFKLLMSEPNADKEDALYKYLFYYKATPHSTTGYTPAELQLGRTMRTRLDFIKLNLRNNIKRKQQKQVESFHSNRTKTFNVDDSVVAKDYNKNNWRLAVVEEKVSPVVYSVRTDDDRLWKRHLDQLRQSNINPSKIDTSQQPLPSDVKRNDSPPTKTVNKTLYNSENLDVSKEDTSVNLELESKTLVNSPVTLRRSSRIIKPRKVLDV